MMRILSLSPLLLRSTGWTSNKKKINKNLEVHASTEGFQLSLLLTLYYSYVLLETHVLPAVEYLDVHELRCVGVLASYLSEDVVRCY